MAISPTSITLLGMGKGDHNKPRDTRELTPAQIAALAKETSHDKPVVATGRTTTLVDPFTTSLLAEVARRQQTQEFDEDLIEEMKETLADGDEKPGDERKSG